MFHITQWFARRRAAKEAKEKAIVAQLRQLGLFRVSMFVVLNPKLPEDTPIVFSYHPVHGDIVYVSRQVAAVLKKKGKTVPRLK